MSAYSQRPPKGEQRLRTTDEARNFKKTETAHGRPPVTDHDIHEDALRNPPHNVPDNAEVGGTIPGMKAPTNEEFYSDEIPEGAMGENILGRRKVDEVQNDLIDQSESTSRS